MRPIKFRAWDKELKRFKYPDLWDRSMPSNWRDWYELQQFTGLLDKGGKEICISDILKLELLSGDLFSEVRVCEKREIPVVDFEGDPIWQPLHAYASPDINDTSVEIIGNIYEQPELIK